MSDLPDFLPEACPFCKGVVWHRKVPCSCTTIDGPGKVVKAADRFMQCVNEFPADPSVWQEGWTRFPMPWIAALGRGVTAWPSSARKNGKRL
jgi:hypothetical protein